MKTNKALNYAVYMLSRRPLTEKMLIKKLSEKEYTDDDIIKAVERMRELGALNDTLYANMYMNSQIKKGYGKNRIKMNLRAKGVEKDIIDTLEINADIDIIKKLIHKKLSGIISDRKQNDKAIAMLMRKGFTYDDINIAMRSYKEEIENAY